MIAKSITFLLFLSLLAVLNTHAHVQQTGTEAGISLYREGKFEQCAAVLLERLAIDSKDKLAWIYLGAAFVQTGNRKEAIKAFRKSNFNFKDAAGNVDSPAKLMNKPFAGYTDQARMNGQTGNVKVAVGLEADGSVGFVLPFETLPWGLTENAVTAAKKIRFKPAEKDGKRVSTVTVLTYSFSIY